jgi:protein-S-isoprenylcysteine O-methyltransferase Ste14
MADRTTPIALLKVPPPAWAALLLAAAYALGRSFGWAGAVYVRSLPLAIALGAAGIGLAVWGALTFMAEGTEIEPTSPGNKKLVAHGPFRFTRNPMYSGLVVTTLGIASYAGTIPFIAVPVLVFAICNFGFIPYEEAKMQRQFGASYTDYCARVRRWA